MRRSQLAAALMAVGLAAVPAAAQPRQAAVLKTEAAVRAVAFSPDGKTLACATARGVVEFFDVAAGKRTSAHRVGRARPLLCVAYSPDGKLLAAGNTGGEAFLWDVAGGQPIRTLKVARSYHVGAVAFSPDGKTLATGSDGPGSVLRLWDVASGEQAAALDDDDSMVYGVAFGPDGKTLASAGGGAIKLWDVAARKNVATFPQRGGHPSVAFRRDGKALAWGATSWYGGVHCEFKVRDLAVGRETVSLKRPGGLRFLAFRPDGKTVAGGGAVWDEGKKSWAGGLVRLWDAATGKETTLFKGDAGGLMAVAFSPDGLLLAAGGGTAEQGEVRLWHFPPAGEKQK